MLKQSVGQQPSIVQIAPQPRRERQMLYHILARLIWFQYCDENRVVGTPFEQAPADVQREILQVCEALTNIVLNPDMKDAAICCVADAICRGNYQDTLTLSEMHEVAPKGAMQYLTTAEDAVRQFLLNLLDNPPDYHYRNSMCRLIDVLAPKKGVH